MNHRRSFFSQAGPPRAVSNRRAGFLLLLVVTSLLLILAPLPTFARTTTGLRTGSLPETTSPVELQQSTGEWVAYDWYIQPPYCQMPGEGVHEEGVLDNVTDGDLGTSFDAVLEHVCFGIRGPELRVWLEPADGGAQPVAQIRVTLHMGTSPVENVDVSISYSAGPMYDDSNTWENITIHDSDVFIATLSSITMVDGIIVEVDAYSNYAIGAVNNPIGFAEVEVLEQYETPIDADLRVLDESGEPLLWNRLVTETLRIEAQILEGERPDVMTATVQTSNSGLTATVALERVGISDIYQGAAPVGQIVDRMVTDTAAAVLYVRDDYTQEEIEREYGVAEDLLTTLGPENAWRGIAQGDGDEEQFIPPANLEFMRAAGYEVVTATLQGAEDVTARAFVHNQAEVLLYIGHGWHDENFLFLNGGDDESSEGNATPESLMDGAWAEGLDRLILMGCSVLDVNDYNDWWTGDSHFKSPGKEWAEIPGPEQLLGFQANAPRINEDQGDRCVELWSLYYIDASPYWCPNEPYGVCAWRLATGMNIAPLTRFPTAVAIDTDKYYYWKEWFRIPVLDRVVWTWQPVPRDEWDLSIEGLEALMASPVNLHFYDRYGNHLGPDGSGGFDTEIPGSSYEIPEGTDYKVAFVKNADLSDEYDVRLVGTGAGTFDFNLLLPERSTGIKYDVAYVDISVITGTLGAIDLQPGTGFTLSLDLDGDGQFDQQLAPTAMQTRTLPYIFADDFDRPDSSDLGPNWVEEAGDWDIVDGQLHAQANGEQGVGVTESFSNTRYVAETRFRATGSLLGPYNAFTLGFGAEDVGGDPIGYSVTYVPAWGKLKLTREYTFLDHASVTLVPGQWYQLKVVRDGDTGLIQVYLGEGQGYPETPTLEAVDSAYPDLRRLGWAVLGSGYDLYVDWIVAQ